MIIRNEKEDDHRIVEELTKRAFWNLHVPGCNEHYLVHQMRSHPDFLPELAFVLEIEGKIIGNIMYTKSKLLNNQNHEAIILTFGPVSIEPQYQRKGYGKKLIEHSFEKAKRMGYNYIVIYGNPCNYVGLGFKSCKRFNIYVGDEIYPSALLVKQIGDNSLSNEKWRFVESGIYAVDNNEAELFDKGFEAMPKEVNDYQEEFYIMSNSRVTA
ncbi:GNAT family N-acetyltransferase [Desulfopila aestuarii]|uniref:Predicted N-acetyltransferase YhbS n=1 Tax=Desulfopila aestuarii DSM 18488 TaxID=1121416 RepID=A0A1M7YLZ2_9BACT|nr:N-acetyltransferase [Desulfopila aestuarii]SHO53618.1 Predicted N-acetyltransferase YhbS [Desulfopila aestuarii DSM 18488]